MIFCGMMVTSGLIALPDADVSSRDARFLGRLLLCKVWCGEQHKVNGGKGLGCDDRNREALRITVCAAWSETEAKIVKAIPAIEAVYHRPMDGVPELTVFILAGGKSTRMGRDKAFVEFQGRTLLARTLDLAASVTPAVRIVGSRKKFAAFAPVVEDVFRDCGPLG